MRDVLSLNGLWYFMESPAGNAKPTVRDWMPVHVPACWNDYAPHLAKYEGIGWFQREFAPPAGPRWQLSFQGVNYQCEVYVNDRIAGEHEGGYTPFAMDVTALIKPDCSNSIRLRVDNSRHLMRIPPPVHGWFNYGGIFRDVCLIGYNRVMLDNVRIQAEPDQLRHGRAACATVKMQASFSGVRPPGSVLRAVLKRAGESAPLASGETRGSNLVLRLKHPALWSPDSPSLYDAAIELADSSGVLDRRAAVFGVRRVEFRRAGFFLNGRKLFLRGINRHDDYPTTKRALDRDVLDMDFGLMRQAGVNALRLAHYPHDPRVLDECDRRGFLVWSEIPVYWKVKLASGITRKLAVNMAREMVRRDWNHPSVAFWGIYNEIDSDAKAARPLVSAIARAVRVLDDTRLVAAASSRITAGAAGDVCLDLLDAAGLNTYPAWHGTDGVQTRATADGFKIKPLQLRHFHATLREVRRRLQGRAFLLSEFGAEGILGLRAADMPKYSEDYQAHAMERQFEVLQHYPEIAGTFVWLFADFPDPSRRETCFLADRNCKGIVDYGRRKKLVFEVLQRIYNRKDWPL